MVYNVFKEFAEFNECIDFNGAVYFFRYLNVPGGLLLKFPDRYSPRIS